MKKYYYLSIIVLSVIFVTGISLVFAQSWQPPAGPPPGNNATAPINVSNVSQTKAGNLWAGNFLTLGDIYADESIVAPNTIESTVNTGILTVSPTGTAVPGEFRWRQAGSWVTAGPLPFSEYEIILGPAVTAGNNSIATCSPGKKVLGGGCEVLWGTMLGYDYPNSNTSYLCVNVPFEPSSIKAYAICASGL